MTTKKTSSKSTKSSSSTLTYNKIAGILSLISLFITGILYMVNFILSFFGGSASIGILSMIANIMMILAIVMISWRALKSAHLPGKKIVWIVIYWVIVALALVGQIALLK